jgi:hypothetical protein
MVDLPGPFGDEEPETATSPVAVEPLVTSTFQDGTLYVLPDAVYIERGTRSRFDDLEIPIEDLEDVTYQKRLIISYIQLVERGVEPATGSRFSTPVDARTLHFGRGKLDCAERARDEIYSLMAAE